VKTDQTMAHLRSLYLLSFFFPSIDSEPPPREEEIERRGGNDRGGGEGFGDAAPGSSGLTDADFDSNWDESIETFDGMELPEELLRGIYSYGFEKPSAIQQRAIRPTILGKDLIAQAQSGTVSFSCVPHCRRDDDYT
jgi:hypothetical protein